jgi:hypothetical protein
VFERYGMESVVSRIDDLYEQILARRPRRVRRAAARRRPSAPQPAAAPEVTVVGRTTEGAG